MAGLIVIIKIIAIISTIGVIAYFIGEYIDFCTEYNGHCHEQCKCCHMELDKVISTYRIKPERWRFENQRLFYVVKERESTRTEILNIGGREVELEVPIFYATEELIQCVLNKSDFKKLKKLIKEHDQQKESERLRADEIYAMTKFVECATQDISDYRQQIVQEVLEPSKKMEDYLNGTQN